MTVTIYDLVTGEILWMVTAPVGLAQQQAKSGQGWVVGSADSLTQYVSGGLITDRPAMAASLDKTTITTAETATLTGPEGAAVSITGPVSGADTLDADGIQISSDIPGTYTVTVMLFPYLDAEYQLEITEP